MIVYDVKSLSVQTGNKKNLAAKWTYCAVSFFQFLPPFCSLLADLQLLGFPDKLWAWGGGGGSRAGAVVRALASHQCGDAISGLSLCWFSSLLRGFFSGFSSFPRQQKPTYS